MKLLTVFEAPAINFQSRLTHIFELAIYLKACNSSALVENAMLRHNCDDIPIIPR